MEKAQLLGLKIGLLSLFSFLIQTVCRAAATASRVRKGCSVYDPPPRHHQTFHKVEFYGFELG